MKYLLLLATLLFGGCNLVSVNVHQSARQVENKDGDTSLDRGNDIKTTEDSLEIPLIR